MKCPRCDTTVLDERERHGVVVDVCPACRGVWLDRGELEKILARSADELDALERGRRRDDDDDDDDDDHRPRRREDDRPREGDRSREPERKRGWLANLGDLFD